MNIQELTMIAMKMC